MKLLLGMASRHLRQSPPIHSTSCRCLPQRALRALGAHGREPSARQLRAACRPGALWAPAGRSRRAWWACLQSRAGWGMWREVLVAGRHDTGHMLGQPAHVLLSTWQLKLLLQTCSAVWQDLPSKSALAAHLSHRPPASSCGWQTGGRAARPAPARWAGTARGSRR